MPEGRETVCTGEELRKCDLPMAVKFSNCIFLSPQIASESSSGLGQDE